MKKIFLFLCIGVLGLFSLESLALDREAASKAMAEKYKPKKNTTDPISTGKMLKAVSPATIYEALRKKAKTGTPTPPENQVLEDTCPDGYEIIEGEKKLVKDGNSYRWYTPTGCGKKH